MKFIVGTTQQMTKQITKIYVDLDGVLVNCAKGCAEVHGPEWQKVFNLDRGAFWKPINEIGHRFWIKLEWIDGSQELWEFLKPFNPHVLTAGNRHHSCRFGKFIWVYGQLGLRAAQQMIICNRIEKSDHAKDGVLLIDDYHKNITAWKKAGGVGILFESVEQTIEELKKFEIVTPHCEPKEEKEKPITGFGF